MILPKVESLGYSTKKFVSFLNHKKIISLNLKWDLNSDFRVDKVHKVFCFEQVDQFREYFSKHAFIIKNNNNFLY